MTRRFQFSLRALLVLMLVVASFFGGIRFEQERRRRADEAAYEARVPRYPPSEIIIDADYWPQATADSDSSTSTRPQP